MRVCIFGAGAVGGHVAARFLARNLAEVSIVARGSHLVAIQALGLRFQSDSGLSTLKPFAATDTPADLPPQDLVVVAVKAPALPQIAASIAGLLAPDGAALFVINGIPWWWRYGLPGDQGPLPLLDPDGALWRELGPQRVLGSVSQSSNVVIEPGLISHSGGNRWVLGEPDGSSSARLATAVKLFADAGMDAEASRDIRRDIWLKLLGNASANPICSLTRLPLDELAQDESLIEISARLIEEILAIAAAQGWDLRAIADVDKLKRPPVRAKGAKPSMLQDVLNGRPTEVEAILGQVAVFAEDSAVRAPTLSLLLSLMRALDRSLTR